MVAWRRGDFPDSLVRQPGDGLVLPVRDRDGPPPGAVTVRDESSRWRQHEPAVGAAGGVERGVETGLVVSDLAVPGFAHVVKGPGPLERRPGGLRAYEPTGVSDAGFLALKG